MGGELCKLLCLHEYSGQRFNGFEIPSDGQVGTVRLCGSEVAIEIVLSPINVQESDAVDDTHVSQVGVTGTG